MSGGVNNKLLNFLRENEPSILSLRPRKPGSPQPLATGWNATRSKLLHEACLGICGHFKSLSLEQRWGKMLCKILMAASDEVLPLSCPRHFCCRRTAFSPRCHLCFPIHSSPLSLSPSIFARRPASPQRAPRMTAKRRPPRHSQPSRTASACTPWGCRRTQMGPRSLPPGCTSVADTSGSTPPSPKRSSPGSQRHRRPSSPHGSRSSVILPARVWRCSCCSHTQRILRSQTRCPNYSKGTGLGPVGRFLCRKGQGGSASRCLGSGRPSRRPGAPTRRLSCI